MSTKYTPEDVQRLVEAAGAFLAAYIEFPEPRLTNNEEQQARGNLYDALASFQPDAEEALIEKMADAIEAGQDGDRPPQVWRDIRLNQARAALAVVKREGLPT